MEELEADRAAQKAEKLRLREEQASKTSTTTTEPSSKESNNESVIDQSRDSNRSVEPMDENSSEDPASSSSKLVASSTGDLSVEERRAEAYLKTSTAKTASTTSTTATGATTTSTSTASSSPSSSESSSESQFNQFLFWRDPPLPLDVDAKSEEKKEESQEVTGGTNVFLAYCSGCVSFFHAQHIFCTDRSSRSATSFCRQLFAFTYSDIIFLGIQDGYFFQIFINILKRALLSCSESEIG